MRERACWRALPPLQPYRWAFSFRRRSRVRWRSRVCPRENPPTSAFLPRKSNARAIADTFPVGARANPLLGTIRSAPYVGQQIFGEPERKSGKPQRAVGFPGARLENPLRRGRAVAARRARGRLQKQVGDPGMLRTGAGRNGPVHRAGGSRVPVGEQGARQQPVRHTAVERDAGPAAGDGYR